MLKERLSVLRGGLPDKKPAAEKNILPLRMGPGWTEIGYGCYRRTVVLPDVLPARISEAPFRGGAEDPDGYLFFDTETTGLSGGSGTLVFLIGLGRKQGNSFVITQLFLADFPGEKDLLTVFFSLVGKNDILVSYNGRAFDTQLLLGRAVLNRMSWDPPAQEDLLYLVRRLWKPYLGSCSLRNVEEKLLDLHRGADVPGFEIPDLYRSWLDERDPEILSIVFEHNLQDIYSLAKLLAHIEKTCAHPDTSPAADRIALALWIAGRDLGKAERLLSDEFGRGNPFAGARLGFMLKKQKRAGEAERVWIELWSTYRNISAGLELAKYFEHRLKKFQKALDLVLDILSEVRKKPYRSRVMKEPLLHREKRLRGKLGHFQVRG
ncbi:MAG: hypothetical protein E4H36_01375 [Spirochaetales bacterium]|nr:MAG: hypothetical protein E4H36_01375 [Spirochaetales bacterium]